jgi:hypothetical protein
MLAFIRFVVLVMVVVILGKVAKCDENKVPHKVETLETISLGVAI